MLRREEQDAAADDVGDDDRRGVERPEPAFERRGFGEGMDREEAVVAAMADEGGRSDGYRTIS